MNWTNKTGYPDKIEENRQIGLRYPELIIDKGKVVRVERKWDEETLKWKYNTQIICNEIHITEIKNDVATQEKVCVLQYINMSGRKETKEVQALKLADRNKVTELSMYGLDINSVNSSDVVKHFNNEMRKAEEQQVTTQAGIIKWNNHVMYAGERVIYRKGHKNILSKLQYVGKLNICRNGMRETYMNLLQTEVLPSVFLSTALAIGVSSLVVGYIGKKIQVQNLLVHLSGESTTGKSTALQLAISVFGGIGNVSGKSSLFSSWNTTENALLQMMVGNYGIAVGLDEAGMSRNKNFASLIYRIAEGKEKLRMEFGIGNKDVREWSTTIISTGEIPLNDVTDQATGQKVRLINFEGIPWTDSAGHSERIKRVLNDNYGFLGEDVAKKLFHHSEKHWIAMHKSEAEKLLEVLECGTLNARIANSLAIITLTARILYTSGIKVDIKGIRDFLAESANKTLGTDSSIGERAFEKIKEEISRNQNNIEIRHSNGNPRKGVPVGQIWGAAICDRDTGNADSLKFEKVSIPTATVETLLKANGFHNSEVIYREWKKRGHIALNKQGKIFFKVKIGKIENTKCLRFLL